MRIELTDAERATLGREGKVLVPLREVVFEDGALWAIETLSRQVTPDHEKVVRVWVTRED